jgi:hypothetical protein
MIHSKFNLFFYASVEVTTCVFGITIKHSGKNPITEKAMLWPAADDKRRGNGGLCEYGQWGVDRAVNVLGVMLQFYSIRYYWKYLQ